MPKLAKLKTRAGLGLDAPLVDVEAHLSGGLPSFSIVGLPETAVRESKDRVRSAILNSQFKFPPSRITISLAPANFPKSGGRYDLPIALAILLASGQLQPSLDVSCFEFFGELGLDGSLRATRGILPSVLESVAMGSSVIVPKDNAEECALIDSGVIFGATSLLQVASFFTGAEKNNLVLIEKSAFLHDEAPKRSTFDFGQIRGQHQAKRALEVALAGGHNLLLMGPPGAGKTLLAESAQSILPPLRPHEAITVASLKSLTGQAIEAKTLNVAPFRSPHHSSSAAAIIGGGRTIQPGEISLAHHGVLFLDELPEFSKNVLESMRQPLESGEVHIARAQQKVTFPASFQLIAAMNPCPCGYFGAGDRCHCTSEQVARYRYKISGPFLDRIDLMIQVRAIASKVLTEAKETSQGGDTQAIRARVISARERQLERGLLNASMTISDIDRNITLDPESRIFVQKAVDKLNLSARAYHRVLKVARTIADLATEESVLKPHLQEAISYRQMLN